MRAGGRLLGERVLRFAVLGGLGREGALQGVELVLDLLQLEVLARSLRLTFQNKNVARYFRSVRLGVSTRSWLAGVLPPVPHQRLLRLTR